MVSQIKSQQIWLITVSSTVIAMAALAWMLWYTRAVMVPFVLAVFVTSMVSPMVDYQVVRLRIPKGVAIGSVLILVLLLLSVMGLLGILSAQTVIREIGPYSNEFSELSNELWSQVDALGISIDQNAIDREVRVQSVNIARQAMGTVSDLIAIMALIFVFAIFLLAGRNSFAAQKGVYAEIDRKMRKYLVTKVTISVLTGLMVFLVLHAVGLRLAFLFGVLAFLLNFIPSLGSIISILLPIPMAIAQFDSVGMVLLAIALPGAVQLAMGNVIEPKIMGVGLGLHPVTVLLSLALWGVIWGIAGMVLAVPITAVLRIVLNQFEITQSAADLLAGILPGQDAELKQGSV